MNEELKKYQKIILGIDPGTNVMGYGILGIINNKAVAIEMGTINLKKVADSYLKLENIYHGVLDLVIKFLPDEMAIEAPFYGKNVQSMLKLGRAQGVAIAAALSREVPISEYEPRKVKLSITGNGGSSKEQVKAMLQRLLNIPEDKMMQELDASDALAIALCHFYESKKVVQSGGARSWKEFIEKHPEKIKH